MFKIPVWESYNVSPSSRNLQAEYERLKQDQEAEIEPLPYDNDREAEMIAEAKLLRQHKGRLEARMGILEDHNKQLEAQLSRLRQLLDQVFQLKS